MDSDAGLITAPIAAFNNGMLVRPDNSRAYWPREVAEQVIPRISENRLDVWLYTGLE